MAILLILVLLRVAYALGKIYLDRERYVPKSIKEFTNEIKTFLGYDFANDFSITEYAVFNTYPDRPTRM